MKNKKLKAIILSTLLSISLVGCNSTQTSTNNETTSLLSSSSEDTSVAETSDTSSDTSSESSSASSSETSTESSSTTTVTSVERSMLDTTQLFSDRDLEQTVDLTNSVNLQLTSGKDIVISEEGVYVISGSVENVTITVEAADDAKVQIVLDGISITNRNTPAIYVKTADKVFVTSTDSDNFMEVSGSYEADGDTNPDAVIFSKSDLTLNGTGTLELVSAQGNGVTSKDDLKITGGTYKVTSATDGMEANDSICIYDGEITINTKKDALHSENTEDTSLGYIYILNGTLNITATDDAIHGTSIVQMDGGSINIETCAEGIEGTYLQINEGNITMKATDDGINASAKSSYDVAIEVNGGTIQVSMGSGDTDAFDSNGDIFINGGTIDIQASSAFDPDGTAQLNGGEVTVNGEVITEITVSQQGGGKGMHR